MPAWYATLGIVGLAIVTAVTRLLCSDNRVT